MHMRRWRVRSSRDDQGVNSKAAAPAFHRPRLPVPQALDSTVAYLGRSFPKFVSLSVGLAALLAPPSHVLPRAAKSSQLVLPLLFGALAPGAEAFELPNRDDVEEDGSDRRLGEAGSCDAGCDGSCNGSCDHCYGCDVWFFGWSSCDHNCAPQT